MHRIRAAVRTIRPRRPLKGRINDSSGIGLQNLYCNLSRSSRASEFRGAVQLKEPTGDEEKGSNVLFGLRMAADCRHEHETNIYVTPIPPFSFLLFEGDVTPAAIGRHSCFALARSRSPVAQTNDMDSVHVQRIRLRVPDQIPLTRSVYRH
jgi:hypothetical protein